MKIKILLINILYST